MIIGKDDNKPILDGYEIVCNCGDHITLTKSDTNSYSGACLGCGIDYVLVSIPFNDDDDNDYAKKKKVNHDISDL